MVCTMVRAQKNGQMDAVTLEIGLKECPMAMDYTDTKVGQPMKEILLMDLK
jgi:hypothetical protein